VLRILQSDNGKIWPARLARECVIFGTLMIMMTGGAAASTEQVLYTF
jgi:hypothetical protein